MADGKTREPCPSLTVKGPEVLSQSAASVATALLSFNVYALHLMAWPKGAPESAAHDHAPGDGLPATAGATARGELQ